jgi:hypothetical protein
VLGGCLPLAGISETDTGVLVVPVTAGDALPFEFGRLPPALRVAVAGEELG